MVSASRILKLLLAALFGLWAAGISTLNAAPEVVARIEAAPGLDPLPPTYIAFNPATNRAYVSGGGYGGAVRGYSIQAIDLESNSAVASLTLWDSYEMAVDSVRNRLYVLRGYNIPAGPSVAIIDGATHTLIKEVPVSVSGPRNLVMDVQRNKLYLRGHNGAIGVLDGATDTMTVLGTSTNFGNGGMAYHAGSDTLITADDTAVALINPTTGARYNITSAFSVLAVVADSPNGKAYLLGQGYDSASQAIGLMSVVDLNTHAVTATFELGANIWPAYGVLSPDGATLYVREGYYPSAVYAVNSATGTKSLIAKVPMSKFVLDANHGQLVGLGEPKYLAQKQDRFDNRLICVKLSDSSVSGITVGYRPYGVAVNPVTNKAYVRDSATPDLLVIDGATRAIEARLSAGNESLWSDEDGISTVAVNPATGYVYATAAQYTEVTPNPSDPIPVYDRHTGNVAVFNGSTNEFVKLIELGESTGDRCPVVTVDPTTNRIYAAYSVRNTTDFLPQGKLAVIDGTPNSPTFHQILATVDIGYAAVSVAINPVTKRLYICHRGTGAENFSVVDTNLIDTASNPVLFYGKLGRDNSYLTSLAVNPQTNRVYVVNSSWNIVYSVNGADISQFSEISIDTEQNPYGDGLSSVAVDPTTNRIYVTDNAHSLAHPSTLNIINGATNTVATGGLVVGKYAYGVAVDPATKQVYIADWENGSVVVVQDSTVPVQPNAPAPLSASVQVPGVPEGSATWTFSATQSSTVAGLGLRVQFSTNGQTWIDLPGGTMVRQSDGQTWLLQKTGLPVGQVSFRIVASAPGHADSVSSVLGPYTIEESSGPSVPAIVVTTTADSGAGSLRQALLDAAATPGSTITFNIPRTDSGYNAKTKIFTIKAGVNQWPAITASGTIIDGASQRTATGDTITLRGLPSPLKTALQVQAANCAVRNLNFEIFSDAVVLTGANTAANTVSGCTFSLVLTGVVLSNDAHDNVVGGITADAANTFALSQVGITIDGSHSNQVLGNYFGLTSSGVKRALLAGVIVKGGAQGNSIGGDATGARNFFGHITGGAKVKLSGAAIEISGATSTGNKVQANSIGVFGSKPASNDHGILVNAPQTLVGGSAAPLGNAIVNSKKNGILIGANATSSFVEGVTVRGNRIEKSGSHAILVTAGTGHTIRENSLVNNRGLGINLVGGKQNGTQVTANDAGDADQGPNDLLNYPNLASAMLDENDDVIVQGSYSGIPNAQITLDLYASATRKGMGETYLGETVIQTDAQGNAEFTYAVTGAASAGFLRMTATDASGNTSEFSETVQIVGHQPDLLVKVGKSLIAVGVYDPNPPQHMVDVQVKGGYALNLTAQVVNRGSSKGSFVLEGPATLGAGFPVRYLDTRGRNVTDAVAAGTYKVTLAPGKSASLKVQITTPGGIPVEQSAEILLKVSAAVGPAHTDAVRVGFTVAPAQ